MSYSKHILLGHIVRIHPYKGLVTIKLSGNISEEISEAEPVFLEIEGKLVPFFITVYEYNLPGTLRLGFEGYEAPGKMQEYNGCRVFVAASAHKEKTTFTPSDLAGFRVFSRENEFIGTVNKVIENPGQFLLQIFSARKKEILVPFHEDLILEILTGEKKIKIEIAEGLTDIN
jgi:16S rRNA processing protein RimM